MSLEMYKFIEESTIQAHILNRKLFIWWTWTFCMSAKRPQLTHERVVLQDLGSFGQQNISLSKSLVCISAA